MSTPNETTTNTVVYGTSVSSVTVAPSPLVASAAATYVVTFKATSSTEVTSGGNITFTETAGPTNFSTQTGVLVSDSTAGWHFVATGVVGTTTGTLTIPMASVPPGDGISSGDLVTVTAAGITNPANATYSDFDVTTSSDTVAAAAPAYTIGVSGSAGILVTTNPSTASVPSTYTISNFFAGSGGITAGSSITLTAPAGTVLPNTASFYSITDSTTATGSGTASGIVGGSYSNTPTSSSVAFTVPNAINANDQLTLTIQDVINPAVGSYTITLTGNVSPPSAIAPFPDANVTYPNGAFVNFGGTIWTFAGGHAFGIATPTLLSKLQGVDDATILKAAVGAIVPVATARAGTLITTASVNGNATIYYVGTDGELHGFATTAQFLADGYDPALTITVPNLGGMTVGSTAGVAGTAGNALATSADGAIVDSSGTYYVFAGSKAFGIPTTTWLAVVKKADSAVTLAGTITPTQTGASIATGVLLSVSGEVYVAYVGHLFGFKSQAQLALDGYKGTAAVTAPNLGGLSVVTGYTGS